uniref:Uncharacterized protein n=1 Tax=Ascaris lumbricoides TaxID=6252 RepID=A0A0M3I979_ASCLU
MLRTIHPVSRRDQPIDVESPSPVLRLLEKLHRINIGQFHYSDESVPIGEQKRSEMVKKDVTSGTSTVHRSAPVLVGVLEVCAEKIQSCGTSSVTKILLFVRNGYIHALHTWISVSMKRLQCAAMRKMFLLP